jgi:hypothetical protein
MKNRDRLSLSMNEADAISRIIRGHGVASFDEIDEFIVLGDQKVNIRKLAACLSLADICHADESRAPSIVFGHLAMDEESAFHWRRHMQISGITRDQDVLLIRLFLKTLTTHEA